MSNNNQDQNPFAGFNMAQLNQLNPALFASLANQMGMNNQAGPSQPQNQAQQPAMGNVRNIPPQLLQQLQQQQRQQSGQPPSQASINDTLQNIMLPTFNRLQNQNSQQMQQERLQAANNPAIQAQVTTQQVNARQAAQAVQAAQAQAHAQAQAQAQVQAQTQQQNLGIGVQGVAGMQGMGGLPGVGGIVGFGGMGQNQTQQPNQPNQMQRNQNQFSLHSHQQDLGLNQSTQPQSNNGNVQQGNIGQGQSGQFNLGMNMGMMGDDSVRRAALQSMLAQSTQNQSQNQPPPPQPAPTNPTPQISPEVHEFMRTRSDIASAVFKKHGNPQAALEDLQRIVGMLKNQNQAQNQPQSQIGNNMGAAGVPVGINGQMFNHRVTSGQTQPAQNQGQSQQAGHQRVPSSGNFDLSGSQFANTLSQLEALQQVKERQQRTGLKTPQMAQSNTLPMTSPQMGNNANSLNPPFNLALPSQPNNAQNPVQNRQTPRMSNNIPTLPSGPAVPRPPQGANPVQPGARPPPNQVIATWPLDKLIGASSNLSKKIIESEAAHGNIIQPGKPSAMGLGVPGRTAAEQAAKFQLLVMIAEIKRRAVPVPDDALNVAASLLPVANAKEQILQMEHSQLSEVAKATMSQISRQAQAQAQAAQAQVQNQQSQLGQGPSQQGSQGTLNAQQMARFLQQQQIQQQQQNQQQALRGSQANPIELVTPTMANTQLPHFPTPSQSSATMANTASQPPQSNQLQGNQSSQPPQANPNSTPQLSQATIQSNTGSGGPDISDIPEESFYGYLRQMMAKNGITSGIPTIEGRQVNLYKLFQMVIKNNGSSHIEPMRWTFVAGQLGFATEPTQPGQPPVSNMQVAQQVRHIYISLLQPMEDAYMAMKRNKMAQANMRRAGMPPGQGSTPGQAPAQVRPPMNVAGPSVTPTLTSQNQSQGQPLSEQQRRFLEAAKNAGAGNVGTGVGLGEAWQGQAQQNAGQGNQSQSIQPPTQPQIQQPAGQQTAAPTAQRLELSALKILEFIKMQESLIRNGLEKQPNVDVNPDIYRNELRTILPIAKEAESRLPIYLLMISDGGTVEPQSVLTIINMCTTPSYAALLAERNRFIFNLADFPRLRAGLSQFLSKAQATYRTMAEKPVGQAKLKSMVSAVQMAKGLIAQKDREKQSQPTPNAASANMAAAGSGLGLNLGSTQGATGIGLDVQQMVQQAHNHAAAQLQSSQNQQQQQPPAQPQTLLPPPTLPKDSPSNLQEAIRHKGLRVEDLKPPPSKRQKSKGSPATPANAQVPTPESAKTPANTAVIGTQGTPGESPKEKKATKRKRQSSTATAAGTDKPVKQTKAEAAKAKKAAVAAAAAVAIPATVPEDPVNALGIQLAADEAATKAEIAQHKAFFDDQRALASAAAPGDDEKKVGGEDAMTVFTKIFEAHQAGIQADMVQTDPVAQPTSAAAGHMPPVTSAGDPNDQDLFDTYFDATLFSLAADLPTPDLVIEATPQEVDGESPESVRTVGSTAGQAVPGKDVKSGSKEEKGKEEGTKIILGSPGSMAYNGGIEW
ncbi:hypothetical protein AYX13_05530 [Cryptococcus neoformans]|nr:hypothetical protein AYX13_05530 [Cryptococcus neoformans var. grubii]